MTEGLDLDALFAQLEANTTPADATPAGASEPAAPSPPAPSTAVAVDDRRNGDRLSPSELKHEIALSIRGGADAKPIDVSNTGILAETTSRLRPGSSVELILQIDGRRQLLKATIVRSSVHSLGPTVFRTAFMFDQPTTLAERKK